MENRKIFVSIIVPVYNVEKYITRCFDSIVNQIYLNIECIFIDDCSPDKSFNILKKLIAEYSGNISFHIERHDENKGLSEARNTGINNAAGEYLYFLDSDDEITKNCIQTLVALVLKYENVDIAQGNAYQVPKASPDPYDISLCHFPEYSDDKLWLKQHFFLLPRIPTNATNKLIKKSFILENNLYFRKGIIHEDELWSFFAVKHINSIAFSNVFCYVRYIVPGSIMQSGSQYKSIYSWLHILKEMIENIDYEIEEIEKRHIIHYFRINMFRVAINKEEQSLLLQYRELIKEFVKRCTFFECLGLYLLLLPYPIYKNIFIRKLTGLLIRL
jgi:glycosyltransferase involved in cell wall biosynthesis